MIGTRPSSGVAGAPPRDVLTHYMAESIQELDPQVLRDLGLLDVAEPPPAPAAAVEEEPKPAEQKRGSCGVLESPTSVIVEVADDNNRRGTFYIENFALVGCELNGSSSAELEVVENELLTAPIDPDLLRDAASLSAALAAIAINASNFACVRLNTVWKKEGREVPNCAVLRVT